MELYTMLQLLAKHALFAVPPTGFEGLGRQHWGFMSMSLC